MVLEKTIGRSFGRTLFAGAIGLASLLYSGKALAQQWPEPTNLGTPMNTAGAELNPERTCDGVVLAYDRKGTDANATRIDGRKLYKVTYNPATQLLENEQPYDTAISNPSVHDASETDLSISCDGRSEVFVRWPSRGNSFSSLAFAQRSAPGAALDNLTTILENWDGLNPETQEMSPTISDNDSDSTNGFTLHFIRYCNIDNFWSCENTSTGVYRSTYDGVGFSTPVRVTDLDQLVDPDNNRFTPNGRIVSIGLQADGSAAVIGYYPAPDDLDVRGGLDLVFIPYNPLLTQFDLASAVRLHQPSQSAEVNTAADEFGASLYLGEGATQPSIYFNATYSWPGATGAEDLYVTPLPPNPCIPVASTEIPTLTVQKGAPGQVQIAYDIPPIDPCGTGINLYVGQPSVAIPRFFESVSRNCHLSPDGVLTRTYVPGGLELYLISSSTHAGESNMGRDSNNVPVLPPSPNDCGRLP